jgi:hypothetical protein
MLYFESLVYIGFDPKLIDQALLDDTDKKYLSEYEAQCKKRERTFS